MLRTTYFAFLSISFGCRPARVAAALTLALVAAEAAPRQLPGQAIDTIVVSVHNVFDHEPSAPALLARLANAFHATTRPWVIRRALLFGAGSAYDSARVVESERALRRLNVFRSVKLDISRLDGRLAVRAETADGWSTVPQVGYGTSAGSVQWEAGVIEENLLGTATEFGVDYKSNPDRHELVLRFAHPSLLVRHDIAVAEYLDRSDGTQSNWIYGVPFYESATPRALTTDGEMANDRVLVFRDGILAASPQRHALRFTVTTGLASSASSSGFTRLLLAASWRREDFGADATAPVPYTAVGTVGIGLDMGRTRLRVVQNLNSFARREDADISDRLNLGVWAAPRSFGYQLGHDGTGLAAAIQAGGSWPGGFGVARAAADGVYGKAGLDSARVTSQLTAVQFATPAQIVVLHAEAGALRLEKPGDEFDLWTYNNGPRLFSAHTFTGNRMFSAALEDRIALRSDFLGLLDVGLAPFVDYGGAWYADESPRLAADAGASLRLGLTRGSSGDVVEYAVGYRFGDPAVGRGWALTIRSAIILFRSGIRRTGGAPNTYGPPLLPR